MNTLKLYPNNKIGSFALDQNYLQLENFGSRFRGVNVMLHLNSRKKRRHSIKACSEGGKKGEKRNFLSLEEAGLVEMSGLSTHERFLCRLTISSLNLLRVISEQEGSSIEDLNAGRICDWFLKDKLKREQNLESAVLQWDDDPLF